MTLPLATSDEILRFLLLLETHKHGYSLHRLWGWVTATEICDEVMKPDVPAQLQRLVKTGHVSRTDVRLRDAHGAVWAYRITQLGADQLSVSAPRVATPALPPAPDQEHWRRHVPTGVRVLLGVLRHVVRGSEIGGSPWRTSRELTELLWSIPKLRRHGSAFERNDLQWAVRNGLAARRDAGSLGPAAYSITPAGADLRYLVWRGPLPGSGRRQRVRPSQETPPDGRASISPAPTPASPPRRGGGGNSLGSGN